MCNMKDSVTIYRLNDDMSTTVLAIQAHHGKTSPILLYEFWNILFTLVNLHET